ncbi:MAG: hypothetical protein M3140_08500 [Actinomycetota bacterium]|nr:hypothetical protein [Actinomycetota bacterium]
MGIISLDQFARGVLREPAAAPSPRIIGVDGPSGSGKSTLARRLMARLPDAGLIEIDDFVSWTDLSRWWPRFLPQVLEPLAAGRAAHYQVRDWVGDEFGSSLNGWRSWSADVGAPPRCHNLRRPTGLSARAVDPEKPYHPRKP